MDEGNNIIFVENGISKKVSISNYFKRIYDEKSWGDDCEVLSGTGSSKSVTVQLRNELPNIIYKYNIKNIVDCGCGVFNYLNPLVNFLNKNIDSYLGIDIVESVISDNNKNSNDKFNFIIDDICLTDKIQNADLVICKEVLMHLTSELVIAFFRNLKKRNVKYILVTSCRNTCGGLLGSLGNLGSYYKLNLFRKPFNFGGPLEVITQRDDDDNTKLYLWKISELPDV